MPENELILSNWVEQNAPLLRLSYDGRPNSALRLAKKP